MVEAIFILCTKDRILFNAPLMYDPHILAVSLQYRKTFAKIEGKSQLAVIIPSLIFCYYKEKDGFHFSFVMDLQAGVLNIEHLRFRSIIFHQFLSNR